MGILDEAAVPIRTPARTDVLVFSARLPVFVRALSPCPK